MIAALLAIAVSLGAPVICEPSNLGPALASLQAGQTLQIGPGEARGDWVVPVDNVTIEGGPDLLLRGTLDLGDRHDVTLRGLSFAPADVPALRLGSGEGVAVEFCRFAGGTTGVSMAGGTVRGCTFTNLSGPAIDVLSTRGPAVVAGNLVLDCAGGVRIADSAAKVIVRANQLVRSPLVVGGTQGLYVGNSLNGAGLSLRPGATDNQINRNTIFGAPQALALVDASANVIHNNWLADAGVLLASAEAKPSTGLLLAETTVGATRNNSIAGNLFQVSGPAVATDGTVEARDGKTKNVAPVLARNGLADNLYDRADAHSSDALLSVGLGEGKARLVPTLAAFDESGAVGQANPGLLGLNSRWLWLAVADDAVGLPGLVDPSLEAAPDLNGQPLGFYAQGTAPTVVQDRDTRDGTVALQVASNQPAESPQLWLSEPLPLVSVGAYGVDLWLRTEQVAGPGGVVVSARWLDSLGRLVAEDLLVGPTRVPLLRRGSQPWTDLTLQRKAPEGATWLQLAMGLEQASGNVRFDGISIDQLTPSRPSILRTPWALKPGEKPPPPKPKRIEPWRPPWGKVFSQYDPMG